MQCKNNKKLNIQILDQEYYLLLNKFNIEIVNQ